MQDSCPMCHKMLHKIDATSQTEDTLPPQLNRVSLYSSTVEYSKSKRDPAQLFLPRPFLTSREREISVGDP